MATIVLNAWRLTSKQFELLDILRSKKVQRQKENKANPSKTYPKSSATSAGEKIRQTLRISHKGFDTSVAGKNGDENWIRIEFACRKGTLLERKETTTD